MIVVGGNAEVIEDVAFASPADRNGTRHGEMYANRPRLIQLLFVRLLKSRRGDGVLSS